MLVENEDLGCGEGRLVRMPRAAGDPGPHGEGVPNTPRVRSCSIRATATCEIHADLGVAWPCGVSKSQVRATRGRLGARGVVEFQRAMLASEQALVENEGMGASERGSALSPRTAGEPGPRGDGVPPTPHITTARGRAATASSRARGEHRMAEGAAAGVLGPAEPGIGADARGAVSSSSTALEDQRGAEATGRAQLNPRSLGRHTELCSRNNRQAFRLVLRAAGVKGAAGAEFVEAAGYSAARYDPFDQPIQMIRIGFSEGL